MRRRPASRRFERATCCSSTPATFDAWPDVDRLLNQILPLLAPGIIVHVHDIFLPDPYPEAWAWRGYNEQSAIAAMLQGEAYELLFASHYLVSRHGERLCQAARSPRCRVAIPPSRAAYGCRSARPAQGIGERR